MWLVGNMFPHITYKRHQNKKLVSFSYLRKRCFRMNNKKIREPYNLPTLDDFF